MNTILDGKNEKEYLHYMVLMEYHSITQNKYQYLLSLPTIHVTLFYRMLGTFLSVKILFLIKRKYNAI